MPIRPLIEADVPQISDLYWKYLRYRKGQAPQHLNTVFQQLCFQSPFMDDTIHPLVFEAEDGRVVGFSGGMVRRMSLDGRPLRVLFGGNLVFHPDFRTGQIAPRFVETFFAQEADLAIVDTANNLARKVLLKNGFRIIPALNMHWIRPLRPAAYALYGLSRSVSPFLSASLNLSKPLCWLADSISARIAADSFGPNKSRLHATEMEPATLLQCLHEFRNGYSLWTQYTLDSLQWLLRFMEQRAARGLLRRVVLREESDRIVGWYIYYVKRGAVGEVVQLGGAPNATKEILGHLFQDALDQGVVGLHGLVEMRRIADFSEKHCLFTCRGGWTMARSRYPELMSLLEVDALFTRLDGEWSLDPGE